MGFNSNDELSVLRGGSAGLGALVGDFRGARSGRNSLIASCGTMNANMILAILRRLTLIDFSIDHRPIIVTEFLD